MQLIARHLYSELKDHLNKPEISLILGPRQAGKTTVIEKLMDDLKQQNHHTVLLNLDIIEDRQFFVSQHTLLEFIEKKVGASKAYVFIDEISRLENAGLFLKGLYDLKSKCKFIVTGSGSLELKSNIIEPLTGRKRIFYCFPLSFTEFVGYKLDLQSETFDHIFTEVTKTLITQPLLRARLIHEYVNFGGYPRVVLAQTEKEKIDVLREIYSSYLEKDIGLLLKIEKENAFANLVKILAIQVGNIINRAELSSTLGLTERTIEKYLYLLEKTFVINLVKPFYRNVRKELIKAPKVYFVDLGFLSIAQGIIPSAGRQITGNMFENACWLRLKELDPLQPPQFWRTKSAAEIDFITASAKTGKPIPIEAKLSPPSHLGRGYMSFLQKYQPDEGYVYYLDGNPTREKNVYSTVVHFVPYHYLPGKAIQP